MWGPYKILPGLLVVFLTVFLPENCWAVGASMKKPCVDCHIMHDSQDGDPVALDAFDVATGPLEGLTDKTCAGCHNGGPNVTDSIPYVVDLSTLPLYGETGTVGHNTLAGGNFYWVAQGGNDLKGHNVVGVGAPQAPRVPPGGTKTFDATTSLTCAGTNGCHGKNDVDSQVQSIWGAHHGNTTGEATATVGPLLTATSYRFLNGIVGWEDDDWELTVNSTVHNQYKGVSRDADDDPDTSSISHLCAGCHGYFHSGAAALGVAGASFGSPWLRHPVDIDMGPLSGAGTEYASYGDGATGVYNVRTPLASTVVSGALGSVTLGSIGNNAIITCISCHRAHGSPWDYSLRWNYQEWPGGVDPYNGCGDCHKAKT